MIEVPRSRKLLLLRPLYTYPDVEHKTILFTHVRSCTPTIASAVGSRILPCG